MTVATHASRKVRKPDIAHHWDGIRGGWLRVLGGKEYKLDHAPMAHRALEMRATQGKVYLTP